VIEQSYEYDLLNPQKLLDKYVGKELTLVLRKLENNTEQLVPTKATLLSNNNGQVWQIGDQIIINPTNIADIRFDRLPADLIAKPTLVWTLNNTAQMHTRRSVLSDDRINWRSDYVVVVNQTDTKADLNGWVTIDNRSGATYRNADLKLVAGDVNRVQEPINARAEMRKLDMVTQAGAPQFQEQAFFEYHLYGLQRATHSRTMRRSRSAFSLRQTLMSARNLSSTAAVLLPGYNNPGEPVKGKSWSLHRVQELKREFSWYSVACRSGPSLQSGYERGTAVHR
jgi:hypothetical protein